MDTPYPLPPEASGGQRGSYGKVICLSAPGTGGRQVTGAPLRLSRSVDRSGLVAAACQWGVSQSRTQAGHWRLLQA